MNWYSARLGIRFPNVFLQHVTLYIDRFTVEPFSDADNAILTVRAMCLNKLIRVSKIWKKAKRRHAKRRSKHHLKE